jgi:hypothetical protein
MADDAEPFEDYLGAPIIAQDRHGLGLSISERARSRSSSTGRRRALTPQARQARIAPPGPQPTTARRWVQPDWRNCTPPRLPLLRAAPLRSLTSPTMNAKEECARLGEASAMAACSFKWRCMRVGCSALGQAVGLGLLRRWSLSTGRPRAAERSRLIASLPAKSGLAPGPSPDREPVGHARSFGKSLRSPPVESGYKISATAQGPMLCLPLIL